MKHTFKKLQLLNITSGILHTKMEDIYKFFGETISDGIMTHHLPNAAKSIKPILQRQLDYEYFTEAYTPLIDNIDVTIEITDEDKKEFWQSFSGMPSLLEKIGSKIK